MKCQNCGNELGQDEVFCGQCGAPNAVPAQQTEMMQQAPAPRSSLLGGANSYRGSGLLPNQSNQPFASENMSAPNQSSIRPASPQSGGFYQDSTEAFSNVPGTPTNYPPGSYPQQGFPGGGSMPGNPNTMGQFGTQQQPFATGNYVNSNANFPPTQMGFSGNQFGQNGYGSGVSQPDLQHKRNNTVMIIGIICLVFAIIAVGTLGTLFALHNNNNQAQIQPTATVAPTATPTVLPSPTPSPTQAPTPTISVSPTAQPDPGYSWCGTQCAGGYEVEYPNGWSLTTTQDGYGVMFNNQEAPGTFAAFKTPSGAPSSANALITSDEAEFQQAQGTVTQLPAPNPPDVTIGGQNWTYQSFLYQSNGQQIQLNIYATINQGKGYVIELAAVQTSFPDAHFNPMLTSFQFVAPTQ